MKFEHKEVINGKSVITTSKRFLFWHKITQYEAHRKITGRYFQWVKLPNREIVPDVLSFQLDTWNEIE